MLTIRQMAKKAGLSRATLLYYDRIGLLKPSSRSRKGYRLYGTSDVARLGEICRYRTSGMAIADIQALLGADLSHVAAALERRLEEINQEIAGLRRQQQVIVELLANGSTERRSRIMTRKAWVTLLDSVGMGEAERHLWHQAFERQAPEAHQDFLEALGIPLDEVRAIRAASGGPKELSESESSKTAKLYRHAPHQRRAAKKQARAR